MRLQTFLSSLIAILVAWPSTAPAADLRLSAAFDDGGAVSGTVPDATITCAGRQLRLSQIRSITLGATPWIDLADGTRVTGPVGGLDSLNPRFPVRLDIRQANRLEISAGDVASTDTGRPAVPLPVAPLSTPVTRTPPPQPVRPAPPQLAPAPAQPSAVSVPTPQKPLTPSSPPPPPPPSSAGGTPSVSAPSATSPDPSLVSPAAKVSLPATATDAVCAANGRYILLLLHDAKQVAVFDVPSSRVVKSIPLSSDDAIITAGADKLLVFSPTRQNLERWNLNTFQREKAAQFDLPELTAISLGYLSHGPALVCRRPVQDGGTQNFCLLDLNTFKLTEIPHPGYVTDVRLNSSARGDLFTAISKRASLSFRLADPLPSVGFLSPSIDLLPSPDGYRFYGSNGTVYNADVGQPNLAQPPAVQGFASAASAIPTAWAGLYIIIKYRLDASADPTVRRLEATLYTEGRPTPAADLPPMPEIEDLLQGGAPTFHNHLFLFPASKRLVTVAAGAPAVYVRNVDVLDLMKKRDPNFLFVSSVPPVVPRVGDPYRYAIQAQSGRGRIKFQLVNPPPDMRITPDGWVTWRVAPLPNQDTADVTITDAAGKAVNYSFPIQKPKRK